MVPELATWAAVLTGGTTKVDDCSHTTDWNPILSAQSTSTFAGLFAGFVFASMIVILTNREKIDNRNADAARALKLLLAAFFALAVTAYLCGVVRGEQECPRAQTEGVINGGPLAIGTVFVLVSLSWIVLAFDRHENGVLQFFRKVVVFATAFVILMLVVSSVGYINAVLPGNQAPNNVAMIVAGCGAVAVLPLGYGGKLLARHVIGGPALHPVDAQRWDRRVRWCAWAGLIFSGVSSILAGVVASMSTTLWYPAPAWVVYTAGWVALAGPVSIIVGSTLATARVQE